MKPIHFKLGSEVCAACAVRMQALETELLGAFGKWDKEMMAQRDAAVSALADANRRLETLSALDPATATDRALAEERAAHAETIRSKLNVRVERDEWEAKCHAAIELLEAERTAHAQTLKKLTRMEHEREAWLRGVIP